MEITREYELYKSKNGKRIASLSELVEFSISILREIAKDAEGGDCDALESIENNSKIAVDILERGKREAME